MSLLTFVLPILAYLLGSVSTAIIVSRTLRIPDPRTSGSRNPGATNVLRLGGKKAAIITLLGDVLKGALMVVVARLVGVAPAVVAAVAASAFIGHLYPVFFHFRGGKGVATIFGALLAISPWVGLILAGIWLVMAVVFRYSSLAALTAAVAAPFLILWVVPVGRVPFFIATFIMCALLIWRHRSNIRNLMRGGEDKIKMGARAEKVR